MADTAIKVVWSLEMVSMLEMLATPRPCSPTSLASVPSKSSSAVGSCLVPSLFFIFIT